MRRNIPANSLIHALNRAVDRRAIFLDPADYILFLQIARWAASLSRVRVLAYCVMPNHWHFVLWSLAEGDVSRFLFLLTSAHAQRWRKEHASIGLGHVYQDRFKSFEIEDALHLLRVIRYVERNALTAGLVELAEAWPWGSLHQRTFGTPHAAPRLDAWPIDVPADWLTLVNSVQTEREVAALRRSIELDRPFGSDAWVLSHPSLRRPRGRPFRVENGV